MSNAAFMELGAVPSREMVFSKAVAIAWKLEFSLAMEPNEARMLERVSFAKEGSLEEVSLHRKRCEAWSRIEESNPELCRTKGLFYH